ncbi:hypothetical protein CKO31_04800 [Thiohalocapsa halophila]|uniref:DUF599 domain-containing protein n=1 Tax=Thiohalocapsa halophila TaxID=69359 RepID=A0ABS1CEY0_9GAMM|nr:DUF599 domain-containing protein [Thiohalocapsa halophila]MBK1630069.1 hypothetical protein [Thiohalocapsa halophila]
MVDASAPAGSARALLGTLPAELAWAANAAALLLLLGYHLYLRRLLARHPEATYRGRSDRLRRAWIETVRAAHNDILAVQTLRNWVMSATLFASTAILIGLGVISVALEGLDLGALSQALSLAPTRAPLVRVKLLFIAALFFIAFLHFALSLRYYNHTGFLINLPDSHFSADDAGLIAETLNRAGGHYNRGTRSFLLAVPLVLWLIGPDWFLLGTIAILFFLYRFDIHADRRPRPHRRD